MALDRLTKVDGGGISTTSDYRVGIITASKFVGPFDGSGGNFSGVVTATNGVFSGNISAVDGNFSGNVTIGGTLTYEDVTNIDSVGIITAQKDIHVGAGVSAIGVGTFSGLDISGDIDVDGHTNLDNVNVSGITTFANNVHAANVFTSYLSSSSALVAPYADIDDYVDVGSNIKLGNAGIITATTFKGDGDFVELDVDGHTNLDNVSVSGVTTFTGITTAGILYATDFKAPDGNGNGFYAGNSDDLHLFHNGSDSYIENDTGNLTFTNKNNNNIIFKTTSSEVEKVRITSAGSVGVGTNNPNVGNSAYPVVQVHGTSTNAYFKLTNTTTGVAPTDGVELSLSGSDAYLTNRENASIIFRTGGNQKLSIDGSGNVTLGTASAAGNKLYFQSTSGAAQYIASGGSNNRNLIIGSSAGQFVNITSAGDVGIGYDSPTVKLHVREAASGASSYDNRYHIIIEDDAEAYLGFYVPDNGYAGIRFSDASGQAGYIDYYFSNDEMHYAATSKHIFKVANVERLRIDPAGNLVLKDHLAQGNSLVNYIQANDVNGVAQYILGQVSTGNQDLYLVQSKNANLRFQTNGSTRWKIDGDPGHLLPETAGAVNIGSASAEIGDVYLADVKSVYLGSGQDVRIYYDSAGSTSFTIDSAAGYTYINADAIRLNSKTSGWNYLRADKSDGVLKLYKSNSVKLATSDTGVTVTGEVAASQDYPVVKPTLDLNFAGTANLDPRVTFTRQGSGSYYGRDGLLKFAAQNEPRFDHDPITRECKGLLIEEQRTNFATNSYRASNDDGATNADHNYNMINNAVTINDFGTAPDGTNTATKMYPASSGSARGIELQMSLNSTGNWTNSIYVKAAGHTGWIALYGVNGGARAYFNPSTGAKGSSGGTAAPSSGKYGIQDVGNGWYRIHLTINLTTTGGTEYHYIYFGDADNSTTVTASGTNGILMWGLQVEKGDFPTSYIRTDSNHRVIRGADQCYIDGQDFLDFYNQTEGTMISSHSILSDEIPSNHNLYTYQIAPTGATAYAPLRILDRNSSIANSIAVASVYNNGYSFLTLDTGNPVTVAGRKYVIAASIKKDDYDAVFDGGDLLSDGSGDLYTADHISIGYYKPSPQAYLNGHIQRLTYYPFKLTNNQLKTVTS